MADCYYHGQSGPGSCPECIEEGRSVVFRGGVRVTAADAAATCELNTRLQQPGEFQKEIDRRNT
jgi:hypothetical protein